MSEPNRVQRWREGKRQQGLRAVTVWLTTTLNIQSKTWEIGILRSLGVPVRDVLGIFLIQGLLIGLVAGFLSRVAAGGIILVMTGAIAVVHARFGWFMNWTGSQAGEGFEYHLLAIALSVVILLRGGGAYSVGRIA